MLKSWKFWSIAGTLALIVSSVGLGTSWSYLKTLFRLTGTTVRDNVPLDFEIERLGTLIEDAQKELRQNQQLVATMEVQIEQLREDVTKSETDVNRAKAELRKLRDYYRQVKESTSGTVQIGEKSYSRKEIENDISRRMQRLEFLERQLISRQEALAKRQEVLEKAKDAVASSRLVIDQLVQKRDELREQKRLLDMQPASANFKVDASKLQEARNLAQRIEAELRTREKMREQMVNSGGEIPIELDDRPLEEKLREKLGE